MNLADVIERVKDIAGKIPNEESTKQHLILPILMALGWNVFSPDEVMPETHTEEGRPDYALIINGRTVAFLEAKSIREKIFANGRINSKHARQLGRYCFDRGVDVGILTNGLQWALIRAYESGKSIDERVILAVDLMNQNTEEAIERLRWFSKEKITDYLDIPKEYSKIPTQVPAQTIAVPALQSSQDHKFRTLYVSSKEVLSPPASAVSVRELSGTDLKGYLPTRLFVNVDGKWYEVFISHAENWPRVKIAWSSITAMAVRFLHEKGVRDFPPVGKYLSKEPLSVNIQYIAKIGEWYLYGPEGGRQAVEVLCQIERHTGAKIAIEIINRTTGRKS